MVKTTPFVSSQPKKVRKQFFNASKDEKHKALSCKLSKELQKVHGIKRLPVRRGDEVRLVGGTQAKREGKVTDVKLSEMRIYVDSHTIDKINGQQVKIPVHPSNCELIKLKMDKQRLQLIQNRKAGRDRIKAKLAQQSQ